MRKNWWKFIGIAILLYTVIVGMGVPLKPGITRADSLSIGQHGNDNTRMQFGETHTLRVESYNTHLTAKDNEAWLKLDNSKAFSTERYFSGIDVGHAQWGGWIVGISICDISS